MSIIEHTCDSFRFLTFFLSILAGRGQFVKIIFFLIASFYILYGFQTFLNAFCKLQSCVHVLFAEFFLPFP